MDKSINLDDLSTIETLKAGDRCLLTGTVYTARDAVHKKLYEMIEKDLKLPVPLSKMHVYYAGPTPAPEGRVIGSCGPTTSGRMDKYAPLFIKLGQRVMIGKGERSQEVIDAIREHKAIYFCATGGAGALLSLHIKSCDVIAFEELGCESLKKLYIEDFPVIVGIDTRGQTVFKSRK